MRSAHPAGGPGWSRQSRGGGRPGGGGGGGGGRQGGPQEVTLVIKQTDNELSLTRKASMGGQERPAVEQKFTLDGKLALPARSSAGDLERAIKGHITGEGALVGTFQH